MGKLVNRQKGFAGLETILVLVIVVAIVGVGWFVYNAKQTADKTLTANTSSTPVFKKKAKTTNTKGTTQTSDLTTNWLSYNDPGGFYSVKIADGWNLVRPTNTSNYLLGGFPVNITYQKGKLATVTNEVGGRDGPFSFTMYVAGQDGTSSANPVGDKQPGLETAQGLKVDKYLYVQATDQVGPGIGKGGKSYTYVISKGQTTVVVGHDESLGDPDNVAMVENVVKTIVLK